MAVRYVWLLCGYSHTTRSCDSQPVVRKVCSADPPASSQGIRRYNSVMPTVKFTYFVKNNRKTSLIGDVFISFMTGGNSS